MTKKNEKKIPKAKLNYPQRVVATPHGLSGNEVDRAHQTTYFILDTLATYQRTFFEREYHKFLLDPVKAACKRIDEEMDKFGINVITSAPKGDVVFNVHFAIYEYQGKKFLCPKMIIRDLNDKYQSVVDGGGILVAPHCLARMLGRSGLEFKDATKLLGQVLIEYVWAMGVDGAPSFYQELEGVSEIGIKGIGTIKCDRLLLEETVYCDGVSQIGAGKRVMLLKTWIDKDTLEDGYFDNGELYKHGQKVQ